MDERDFHDQADASASDLLPALYEELRLIARGQMLQESGPQTLSATALVHEAWLRVGDGGVRRQSRRHFFGAAAGAGAGGLRGNRNRGSDSG